jgi:hypothetical protein
VASTADPLRELLATFVVGLDLALTLAFYGAGLWLACTIVRWLSRSRAR